MKPLDHVIARPLDDGLVVARPGGHRLFVMNSSARFIWEKLASGIDDTKIPSLMADHYGIDIKQAESDFRKTVLGWQREGLAGPLGRRRHYAMARTRFSIDYPDEATEATIAPNFGHLEVAPPASPGANYQKEFTVARVNGQFALRADGIDLIASGTLDMVVERLSADVLMHCYQTVDWVMSIHAAAVAGDDACVLLPGASGAGKSTLAAFLLGRSRVRYMTDDIVVLERGSLAAIAMPGPLVLKSGSWRLLQPVLPALARRTVHRRNGEDVRFWAPDRSQVADAPRPIKAIVFPEHGDHAETTLTALSVLEGLNRLLSAPATISSPITTETVDRLMRWAHGVPFHAMRYGRLEDAAVAVEALLGA
ncbi:MAG: hypothetical protein P4M07_11500 [Xanthobacteraceae bacterium]|nr:hypothetical protein [Xanthobacteraceae bacterium]